MSTWNSPPQVPNVPAPPHNAEIDSYVRTLYEYIKTMANVLSAFKNDMEFFINGTLDVSNIRAEGIYAKNIKAGAIETDKLAAGAVTADKITVNELSAISADLGHITAGLIEAITMISSTITGSLIQTSASSYPRAEMRSSDQMFEARSDADQFVRVIASAAGVPSIVLGDDTLGRGSISYSMDVSGTKKLKVSCSNGVNIEANNYIDLVTGLFAVRIQDWNSLIARSPSGQTLQQALNAKANGSGFNGSIPPGSTINVSNGVITGYF